MSSNKLQAPNAMMVRWSLLFFASRRQHTRSYGDWSSDVCSSDLEAIGERAKSGEAKRNLEQISNLDYKALGGPERLMGELGSALKKLPVDHGAAAAFALGSQYAK